VSRYPARVSRFPLPFAPGLRPTSSGPSLFFAFRRRELLLPKAGPLAPVAGAEALGIEPTAHHYLGELEGVPCWALDLPAEAEAPLEAEFWDLRRLFGRLPEPVHAVAGRAVQIVEWDRSHRFCGRCGSPTAPLADERARSCPHCQIPLYPRLAPSMIVAVERGDEILLARSPHFPPGIYSVLAGFVEAGESVEECIRREVWEETKILVEDVRYFSSQPWPYPHSLMLGFQARYAGGEIQADRREIEDAGWFRADAMPGHFPGRFSIAQWLMHDFRQRHGVEAP